MLIYYLVECNALQHLHCVHSCVFLFHCEDSLSVLIHCQYTVHCPEELIQFQHGML